MNKLKEVLDILLMKPWWIKTNTVRTSRAMVSVIFCAASFILCIMNFVNDSMLMFYSSIGLTVGFAASSFFALVLKKENISGILIAFLVCTVLSLFAISGGNGGFAILWIILVPILAVNVLGVTYGFLTATYFLVFVFCLFYTPLNTFVADKYTDFFMGRFPILYFCDYVLSIFLSFQKEYFNRVVHLQSHTDSLTGCYNRLYYSEHLEKQKEKGNFSLVLIDINGLKRVNDSLGHEAGDELICGVTDCYYKVFGRKSAISSLCRIGGDEFVILLSCTGSEALGYVESLKHEASVWKGKNVSELTFSIGCASSESFPELSGAGLYKKADELMYADKVAFYEKNGLEKRKY